MVKYKIYFQGGSIIFDGIKSVNRVIDYIEDHITEEINCETLAQITGLSVYEFRLECTPKIDLCVSLMNIPHAVTTLCSKENLLFFYFENIETKLTKRINFRVNFAKKFPNSNLTVSLFSLVL